MTATPLGFKQSPHVLNHKQCPHPAVPHCNLFPYCFVHTKGPPEATVLTSFICLLYIYSMLSVSPTHSPTPWYAYVLCLLYLCPIFCVSSIQSMWLLLLTYKYMPNVLFQVCQLEYPWHWVNSKENYNSKPPQQTTSWYMFITGNTPLRNRTQQIQNATLQSNIFCFLQL